MTGIELLWRWLAAAPLLWLGWRALALHLASVPLDTMALSSMTFFEPVRSVTVLAHQIDLFLPLVQHTARWWIPLAFLLWGSLSALGRTITLRRADPGVHSRLLLLLSVRLLRALAFYLLLALWGFGVLAALHATITDPGRTGAEPNIVLFTAEAVGLTLAAFMLWSLTSWNFDVPPLIHMTGAQLDRSQRAHLRSKLVETNLVMGIVRVALFVLAMTFSASPLPFQSQETQAYINVWWIGVGVFYVVTSDFFHVVRRVTYLRLLQTIAAETNVQAPAAS